MDKSNRVRNTSKGTSEGYRRRKRSLIHKLDELRKLYSADVYFVACRNGYYSVYKSTDREWPPSFCDIVSLPKDFSSILTRTDAEDVAVSGSDYTRRS